VLLDERSHVIIYGRLKLILRILYIIHDHLLPLKLFLKNLPLISLLELESLSCLVNLDIIYLCIFFFLFTFVNNFLRDNFFRHYRGTTLAIELLVLIEVYQLAIYKVYF
jgi:hypothetical protein